MAMLTASVTSGPKFVAVCLAGHSPWQCARNDLTGAGAQAALLLGLSDCALVDQNPRSRWLTTGESMVGLRSKWCMIPGGALVSLCGLFTPDPGLLNAPQHDVPWCTMVLQDK